MVYYGYNPIDPPGVKGVKICNDFIDDKLLESMIKKLCRPEIGQIKFIARNNISSIDYSEYFDLEDGIYTLKDDTEFNGWVYPDGKKYGRKNLEEAYFEYGIGGSDYFEVPSLSNFLKLNPRSDINLVTNANRKEEFYNPVPEHYHNFEGDSRETDINVSDATRVFVTNGYSSEGTYLKRGTPSTTIKVHNKTQYEESKNILSAYYPGFHAGDYDVNNKLQSLDLNLTVNSNFIGSSSTVKSGSIEEAYPSYVNMPVMIYIGGQK